MHQKVETLRKFTDVDNAIKPELYVDYLETTTSLSTMQQLKKRSYDLMQVTLGDRVLDVGCGTGDDVLALAKLVGPTGHAIGIDRSKHMIEEAEHKATAADLNVTFQASAAENLKFADNSFDSCRAERVLQHVNDRQRVLNEMIRVVRPGGRIVIIDPDWDALSVRPGDKAVTRRVVHSSADVVKHGATGTEAYGLFKQAGLIDVSVAAITLMITEFGLANHIFGFDPSLERLQAEGKISAEAAASWRNQLVAASEAGHFFSALTGFIVSGTKPDK